jgi:hypothetical protein
MDVAARREAYTGPSDCLDHRADQFVSSTESGRRSRFLFLCLIWAELTLTAALAGLARPAYSQAITQDVIVAPASQVRQLGAPLEKVIGYFTSTTVPSIVVGFAGTPGGLYLYTSTSGSIDGPWQQTVIANSGDAYERAVAFTYPGDVYPGVVASIQPAGSSNHQIIWYQNPKNRGLDPTADPWSVQVINPNSGCHDIRLADIDGDGKLDVVCSGSTVMHTGSFVAFQDDRNKWQVVGDVARLGDGVDAITTLGEDSNLVGASAIDGNVYWYQNPCTRIPFRQSTPCSASRSAGWKGQRMNSASIGDASGNSFTTIAINGVDGVITASNEEENPVGVAWYYPGTNPSDPWNILDLDHKYRDVHEINTGIWNDGTPYVIVAEQEQACPPNPNPHHTTPCRIAMFQYAEGEWKQTVLSKTSTHNQSVMPWRGGLLMLDANHGVYGADQAIHVRVIQP